MKRLVIVLCIFAALSAARAESKLKVAATIYPLEHFAAMAGGDNVEAVHIIPPGVDAHSFDPSPKDIIAARNASVLLMNGGGLDDWAVKLAEDVKRAGGLVVVMYALISSEGSENPHLWLDPLAAVEEVRVMRDAFIAADNANAKAYRLSSEAYIESLKALHERFASGIKDCRNRSIVVSHDAFSLMTKRYGIRVISIKGTSTEEEPSLRRIAYVVEEARRAGIRHVFAESMGEQRLAQTVANELDAKVLRLHSIEVLTPEQQARNMGYIDLMDENLSALREALGCR